MTIKNDLNASKTKTRMMILLAMLSLGVVGSFFPLYLDPQWFMIMLGVVSMVLLSMMLLADHHYFWMTVEGDKLKIRYYSVVSFLRRPQVIEISMGSLKSYSLGRENLGLKRTLILKQRVKQQVATYPGVPISTLSKKELNALVSLLNRLAG